MTENNTMETYQSQINLCEEKLFEIQRFIKTTGLLCSAMCEFNTSQFIALMTENSEIIFYFKKEMSLPIVKRILWFQGNHKQVSAFCFDISGAFLLSVSIDGSLCIIPALAYVDEHYNGDSRWNTMDITHYPLVVSQSTYSRPTAIVWWQDDSQLDIAIIGTECGEIVFINLESRQRIYMTCINESISVLQICKDNSNNKYLLITSPLKRQWRLMLEEQKRSCLHHFGVNKTCNVEESNNTGYSSPKTFASTRSKLQELKQLSVEKLALLKQKLIETKTLNSRQDLHTNNIDNCNASAIDSDLSIDGNTRIITAELLPKHIFLEPQIINASQQLYTSYDCINNSVTFYGINFSPLPLAEYKVPVLLGNIILTQKFLFVTDVHKQNIYIISSQLSEICSDKENKINTGSVIAQFSFDDKKEVIRSLYKSTDFETGQQNFSDNINNMYKVPQRLKNVTIDVPHVDTVIVITNRSVYKIILRVPLLPVFMDIVLIRNDIERAKILALVFGVNLPQLLEYAGDILLSSKELSRAINIYRLAKCRLVKTVLKFASFGYTAELLNCLMHCLDSPSITELSTSTRTHFSNLCVLVFINIMLRTTTLKQIRKDTMYFLSINNFYDELLAAKVAGQTHLWEILHYLAVKRGLHEQILNILLKNDGCFGHTLDNLYLLPYGFLICISEPTLMQAMLVNNELGQAHMKFTVHHLAEFQLFLLQRLIALYDPTNPVMRPRLVRCKASNEGASRDSQSQDESVDSTDDAVMSDTLIEGFIETFLLLLITFIHKKSLSKQCIPSTIGIQTLESTKEYNSSIPKIDFKRRPISSGYSHVTLIRNHYVFTWGSSARGVLGTGPSVCKYDSPRPLAFFRKMKLEILSVSGGHYHTLAVTNNGVYAWGSNQYGQLGIAGLLQCSTPRLITILAQENIMDAVAGQYHSVALTADGRVYTWGWGVHGQLGHGKTDELYTPTLVSALLGTVIYCITAGHAHTLLLSTEGIVYAFGCNVFGQLGTGDTKKSSIPIPVLLIPEKITFIATGYFHNLALSCTNKLYVWGASPQVLKIQANAQKKSRTLHKKMDVDVPDDHKDDEKREGVVNNSKQEGSIAHNLIQDTESLPEAYSIKNTMEEQTTRCDNNTQLCSGLEETPNHLKPRMVDTSLVRGQIIQISAGCHHNALVTKDGSLYTWGRNLDGQLGNGTRREVAIPTPLTYNPSYILAQVPPRHHNRSNRRQAGLSREDVDDVLSPIKCESDESQLRCKEAGNLEEHTNPTIKTVSISCGYDYTLAIQPGGAVLAWGNNSRAQLGRAPANDVKDGDVKLVLLKSSKRIVRIPQISQTIIDSPSQVPNIPAPIISYQDYEVTSLAECIPPLSLVEKSPAELTLHYVLDYFSGLYDSTKILEKCIQLENYQACAKIATLQQNIPDAFSFQLKTLYALSMKSLTQLDMSEDLIQSTVVKNSHSVEESMSANYNVNRKIFNEQIEKNFLHTVKDSAMKNHIKMSSSKSLNNLETVGQALYTFDYQGAPEQLCTDSKCGKTVLALFADEDYNSVIKRDDSDEWIESILSVDLSLDQHDDRTSTKNTNFLNTSKASLGGRVNTIMSHNESCINSNVGLASRSRKNNVINEALKLIKFYLCDIEKDTIETKCRILKSAIDFWIRHNLPKASLENALTEHIQLIFYSLGLLIFCQDAVHKYLFNQGYEGRNEPNIIQFFSFDFCLHVCSMLLQYVNEGHLIPEYVTILSSITAMYYASPLVEFVGCGESTNSKQMMQGVINTIANENCEPASFIHMKEPDAVYNVLLAENDTMIFTCGHSFPLSSYLLEIIPGMETELLMKSSLPCTAQLLEKLFSGAHETELLCPLCIPHALEVLTKDYIH